MKHCCARADVSRQSKCARWLERSAAVLSRLLYGDPNAVARVGEALFASGGESRSLAAVYRAAGADKEARHAPKFSDRQ
jgi:hypothetical protein